MAQRESCFRLHCAIQVQNRSQKESFGSLLSRLEEDAVVHLICFLCRSDGKRPAMWEALNVAKRSKP